MNKSLIKKFATQARSKLLKDIEQKAYEYGITSSEIKEPEVYEDGFRINQRLFSQLEMKQRKRLIKHINDKGFDQIVEEVAYTWFNRFIALRYMEVNGYLPSGVRVLSSEEQGKMEPDIIQAALMVDLDLDLQKVYHFQDVNDAEGLYKYLLIKQCNDLHKILPVVFAKIDDYTELLLPNQLLNEGSIIHLLNSTIPEDEWKDQVEIIGWLYQFYQSEKKDQVFADLKKNKKITKESIAAVTQLFTPKWIVQYMLENSLGRLWMETGKGPEIKEHWHYYIEQQVVTGRSLLPEDITIIDPCMGSGHILVYAFDLLYEIYIDAGYTPREIPQLIIENNLYGLDIDERATQLGYFALMMKARSYHRRIFREELEVNVCSIHESNTLSTEAIDYFIGQEEVLQREFEQFIRRFYDAKEYGSILDVEGINIQLIEQRLNEIKTEQSLNLFDSQNRDIILEELPALIKQAKILKMKYDVTVTNPPYMGASGMNPKLVTYLKEHYRDSKSDLYAVFIEKLLRLTKENGYSATINQHSWMFLSSYQNLRQKLLMNQTICSMVHLGSRAFEEIGGEVVQTTAYVLQNSRIDDYSSVFIRLVDYPDSKLKQDEFFRQNNRYTLNTNKLRSLPTRPIAYWASNEVLSIFDRGIALSEFGKLHEGVKTRDNQRFLRYWYEPSVANVSFTGEKGYKWYPYSKGGAHRKWYGNNHYVINWENNGAQVRAFKKSSGTNAKGYFTKSLTWNALSGNDNLAFRHIDASIWGGGGSALTSIDEAYYYYIAGYLNTKVATKLFRMISATLNREVGQIGQIPLLEMPDSTVVNEVTDLVKKCIKRSKQDFDSFETSPGFEKHPFLQSDVGTIEEAYIRWEQQKESQFLEVKNCEEHLNQIFIDLYKLEGELQPELDDIEVTIEKADQTREIKSFVSYAVGCMFGRYSLSEQGIVSPSGQLDEAKYQMFPVEMDNIIPITDEEYFDRDIVTRFVEFLQQCFGQETLEENLNYIASVLGKKTTETARQAIRRYFIKDFYKDHVQMYNKRPIYWLFDSGKHNGFKALSYVHRFDLTLVARLRTEYLHQLQKKYEAEKDRLNSLTDADMSARESKDVKKKQQTLEKQMHECLQYDQVIAHLANKQVMINLDKGIKDNYEKFLDIELTQEHGGNKNALHYIKL